MVEEVFFQRSQVEIYECLKAGCAQFLNATLAFCENVKKNVFFLFLEGLGGFFPGNQVML